MDHDVTEIIVQDMIYISLIFLFISTAVRLIIRRKLNATLKHSFAIATYNSDSVVTWREGFTSDYQLLDNALSQLTDMPFTATKISKSDEVESCVQLADVFEQLMGCVCTQGEEIRSPEMYEVDCNFLTRFIFIYVRSDNVPEYSSQLPFFQSPSNKTHFIDILFLHHKLASHRDCVASCQETLNVLSLLQRGGERI